jgi:hypothetical protein
MMNHLDNSQVRSLGPLGVRNGDDGHSVTQAGIPFGGVWGERTVAGRDYRQPRIPMGLGRTDDGVIMDDVAPGEGLVGGLHVAEFDAGVTYPRRLHMLEQPLPADRAA